MTAHQDTPHIIQATTNRIMRLKQVCDYIGLSRSTIYDLMNPKSPRYDSTFPKAIQLTTSCVGWVTVELDSWIDECIQLRNEGK